METKRRQAERKVGRQALDERMEEVVGGAIHAPRVAARRDGVAGVLPAARLGVRALGQGVAIANGLAPRQAIQPVDRRVSNPQRMREDVARCGVRVVVATRTARLVNGEWTEWQDAAQARLVLGTQTAHGRRTPLVGKTGTHAELKDQRHAPEDARLGRFAAGLPPGVRGTVVADRGFSARPLYRFLQELGFESIRRCRGVVCGEAAEGERRNATDGLGVGGRRRGLRGPRVPAEGQPVPMVGCVQPQQLQEPWVLASSRRDLTGPAITRRYGTRVTVAEPCRAVQHPQVGLGRKPPVRERHDRRDARLLLAVLAHTWLTRLGKAGEALGMDRWLGATRPRPYSRFRQGQMRFDLLPPMARQRLRPLLQRFGQWLRAHARLAHILGYR